MNSAIQVAWYSNIVLAFCLLIRLYLLRFQRLHRIFAFFVLADLLISFALWASEQIFHLPYPTVWLITSPIRWSFYIVIVYALMQSVTGNFPGLFRLFRRALAVSLLVALVMAGISAQAEINLIGGYDPIQVGLVVERAVTSASLLFLLLTMAFLFWFPVQLSKNVVAFCVGYFVLFSTQTSLLLARNLLSKEIGDLLNLIMMIISTACYAFWLLFLSKAGEAVPIRVGHRWNPAQQEKLLGQLDAINASLLKSARRS